MKLSLLWLVGLALVLPDTDLIGFEVKRLKIGFTKALKPHNLKAYL
jgi:hypothetical protein